MDKHNHGEDGMAALAGHAVKAAIRQPGNYFVLYLGCGWALRPSSQQWISPQLVSEDLHRQMEGIRAEVKSRKNMLCELYELFLSAKAQLEVLNAETANAADSTTTVGEVKA